MKDRALAAADAARFPPMRCNLHPDAIVHRVYPGHVCEECYDHAKWRDANQDHPDDYEDQRSDADW